MTRKRTTEGYPLPGILYPVNGDQIQRDDADGMFEDDEAAARFLAEYSGHKLVEYEDDPEQDPPGGKRFTLDVKDHEATAERIYATWAPRYYSVVIPYADVGATEWHPTKPNGPFNPIERGAFASEAEAHEWAAKHLNGTAYSVRSFLEP